MIKLARTDLVGTDPGQLRAAIKLPRAVKPQRMVLRIDVKLGDGEEQGQDFRLREMSEPRDVPVLHRELDPNTHVYAYQIDPADQGRLIAFRELLKEKQKAKGGKGGALSIWRRAGPPSCPRGRSISPPICARRRRTATCRSPATWICARSCPGAISQRKFRRAREL
ncbi:MAG: hypothetical protein ACJ8ES_10905 [Xanthobacteraceae bacterium]